MHERVLRPVLGFPHYLVGDDGTVWSLKQRGGNDHTPGRLGSPRLLRQRTNQSGYGVVQFDDAGRVVTKLVHRLVLEAFVGPCPSGAEACHAPDPRRDNNHLDNLRWDTKQENAKDRYRDRPPGQAKVCSLCHHRLPPEQFYTDIRASDGRKSACKSCHNRQSVATRDVEKKRALTRVYMRRVRAQTPERWR